MKSLALYIDKWYIIGAVCVDGTTRPIKLPNNEDRIWLYFHEDTTNDIVSYGKGFKSHYWNRENHYYGDIFAYLTNSAAKFTMFKHSQPIKDIFKMGKVFDDLKAAFDNENDIPTYLCFSKDISSSARLIFCKELKLENFQIEESVARIDHLALEYAVKKNGFSDEGQYLVLNACNENLHYSIYKRSGNIFLRMADNMLSGMGTDLRRRCLIEYVVDSINQTERFLKSKDELETEYLRCSQYVEDWILKISTANLHIPIQITDITLSKDPHKTYSVAVKRKQIDEKTEVIAKNLVDEIVRFVGENDVSHEKIAGIVYLGNTFTNKQFTSQFLNHYNLKDDRMICYMDKDLSMLVSAYSFIDCSQFNELESKFTANAEDELRRIKIAEEERLSTAKAEEEAAAFAKITQAKKEEEAKFRQAMDRGYESESNHDYENMVEFFEIAKNLRPDDEEASAKYEEALRQKTEQSVLLKTFKEKLQQAMLALNEKDWELAKQKAEEALSSNPVSKEARLCKDEANRQILQQKDFDRHIDRADLFIAQKLYKEASEELEKARLLSIDDKIVNSRLEKIKELKNAFKSKIDNLINQLNKALKDKAYSEAIQVCNELREEDITNQIKWTNKLTDINLLQQGEKERVEKIHSLKSEIDTAQWSDDWQKVAEKCRELLTISQENGIKEKLAVAKEKLKIIEEKNAIEKAITEIKDLIVRAEFDEAKKQLNAITRGSNDPDFQRKIKDLRKLLFERETERETTKKVKESGGLFGDEPSNLKPLQTSKPRNPIGFTTDKSDDKKSQGDGFFDDNPKTSKRPIRQQKNTHVKCPETNTGFFDSIDKTKSSPSSKKGYTLDDFNF